MPWPANQMEMEVNTSSASLLKTAMNYNYTIG